MNELGYQRLILKSIIEAGGAGWKLSNRFLIGVPDLLIQDPEMGASLWEVKKTTFPYDLSCQVKFKVTKIQLDTLVQWGRAGGSGGVIVIATRGKDAFINVFPTRSIGDTIVRVSAFEFDHLARGRREAIIVKRIRERM